MATNLKTLLHTRRGRYIEGVMSGLIQSKSPRYKELTEAELRDRASKLVDALLVSLVAGPGRFILHVKTIAVERFSEGFGLFEVHRALRLLEEQLWEDVVAGFPAEEHAGHLSRVAGTIGAARDQVALLYLSLAAAARRPHLDPRRHKEDLFKGTDSAPLAEELEELWEEADLLKDLKKGE